jgi:uncharacterized protein
MNVTASIEGAGVRRGTRTRRYVSLTALAGWAVVACSKPPSLADEDFAVVLSGEVAEVARMLDRGARVDETGYMRRTALWYAARNGDVAMVSLLLERGADAQHRPSGIPPLVAAAHSNSLPIVARLLEEGVDPNGEGMPGQNAIASAASKGNLEMVRLLLDAGAHAGKPGLDGETPLYIAALSGHREVVVALLETKAVSIDAQTESEGATALMAAAWRRHEAIVDLLLAAGADRGLVDKHGRTAADHAERMGEPELAERIRSYGSAEP